MPSPGSRKPPSFRARVAWDCATDVWEDFQESGKDFARDRVHGPALLKAVGPLRGKRVLDLGCGQGRFTRLLARRGGKVCGIDWSERMINAARQHEAEAPLGIEYRVLDARRIPSIWKAGSFDVVVACMSLMDMPDLRRVLRGVRTILRPGGRLVLSISHPLNTSEVGDETPRPVTSAGVVVDRYFERRVGVTRWEMRRLSRPFRTLYWHRPLEDWFRLLSDAGFEILNLTEPHPTAAAVRQQPGLERCRRVPFFLVLSCRRTQRA